MLNTPTNGGITPLMLAINSKSAALVQACLAAGMDQSIEDFVGRNALDYATQMGGEGAQIVGVLQGTVPQIARV